MNDPHVVALHYVIIVGPDCDFDKAPPLKHQEAAFDVEVAGRDATFTMKQHFATADEARFAVQPFVDAWNVTSGLDKDPSAFRLEFNRAELEHFQLNPDRIPRQQSSWHIPGA